MVHKKIKKKIKKIIKKIIPGKKTTSPPKTTSTNFTPRPTFTPRPPQFTPRPTSTPKPATPTRRSTSGGSSRTSGQSRPSGPVLVTPRGRAVATAKVPVKAVKKTRRRIITRKTFIPRLDRISQISKSKFQVIKIKGLKGADVLTGGRITQSQISKEQKKLNKDVGEFNKIFGNIPLSESEFNKAKTIQLNLEQRSQALDIEQQKLFGSRRFRFAESITLKKRKPLTQKEIDKRVKERTNQLKNIQKEIRDTKKSTSKFKNINLKGLRLLEKGKIKSISSAEAGKRDEIIAGDFPLIPATRIPSGVQKVFFEGPQKVVKGNIITDIKFETFGGQVGTAKGVLVTQEGKGFSVVAGQSGKVAIKFPSGKKKIIRPQGFIGREKIKTTEKTIRDIRKIKLSKAKTSKIQKKSLNKFKKIEKEQAAFLKERSRFLRQAEKTRLKLAGVKGNTAKTILRNKLRRINNKLSLINNKVVFRTKLLKRLVGTKSIRSFKKEVKRFDKRSKRINKEQEAFLKEKARFLKSQKEIRLKPFTGKTTRGRKPRKPSSQKKLTLKFLLKSRKEQVKRFDKRSKRINKEQEAFLKERDRFLRVEKSIGPKATGKAKLKQQKAFKKEVKRFDKRSKRIKKEQEAFLKERSRFLRSQKEIRLKPFTGKTTRGRKPIKPSSQKNLTLKFLLKSRKEQVKRFDKRSKRIKKEQEAFLKERSRFLRSQKEIRLKPFTGKTTRGRKPIKPSSQKNLTLKFLLKSRKEQVKRFDKRSKRIKKEQEAFLKERSRFLRSQRKDVLKKAGVKGPLIRTRVRRSIKKIRKLRTPRLAKKNELRVLENLNALEQRGVGQIATFKGKKFLSTRIKFPSRKIVKKKKKVSLEDFASITAVIPLKDLSVIVGKTITKEKNKSIFIGLIRGEKGKGIQSLSSFEKQQFQKALSNVLSSAASAIAKDQKSGAVVKAIKIATTSTLIKAPSILKPELAKATVIKSLTKPTVIQVKQKIKIIDKTILKSKAVSNRTQKQISTSKTKQEQLTSQISQTKNKQKQKQLQQQKNQQKTKQTVLQKQLQKQAQKQRLLTRQKQIQKQKIKSVGRAPIIPRIIPIPRIPVIGRKKKGRRRKRKPKKIQAYNTFARPLKRTKKSKRPKLVKVNKVPLRKGKAEDLRNYILDTSLARTGRIKPTKGKPKRSKVRIPTGYAAKTKIKFRTHRIVKGKRKPLPKGKVIERRKRLLDTPQEKRKISLRRRMKQITPKPKVSRKKSKRKSVRK